MAPRDSPSLALSIKAKLEGVESGVLEFETEFMPYTMLPNGRTVAEWTGPQIEKALESNKMPPLLIGMEGDRQ